MAEVFTREGLRRRGLRAARRGQAHPAEHRRGRRVHHDVHRRGEDRGAAATTRTSPRSSTSARSTTATSSRSSTSTATTCARSSIAAAQRGEPMPIAQACFVVDEGLRGPRLRAQQARRSQGRELHLVHRDVSPQNVLVSLRGRGQAHRLRHRQGGGQGVARPRPASSRASSATCRPSRCAGCRVDRRSDIFACGIVLYELLTGERLFVGESDFSTLEKVRNVEILPPSTYNRKIPDELERIVLKALAKDVEDRYQNAIDLHDELQAFLYTAGEFYSRKDLAAWMKKTFAREIEEETAKLESYRQLKAAAAADGRRAVGRAATSRRPPTRTPSLAQVIGRAVRSDQDRTAAAAAASHLAAGAGGRAPGAATPPPTASARRADRRPGELAWDDDELETQIYDNPEDDRSKRAAARPSPAARRSRWRRRRRRDPGAAIAAARCSAAAPRPGEPHGPGPVVARRRPRRAGRSARGSPNPADARSTASAAGNGSRARDRLANGPDAAAIRRRSPRARVAACAVAVQRPRSRTSAAAVTPPRTAVRSDGLVRPGHARAPATARQGHPVDRDRRRRGRGRSPSSS